MPIPFHCHECDKPTMNPSGLCDEHQVFALERTDEGIIPYIERMPEPKPLNDSFIDVITQGKADIENIITLNDLSQEK